MGWGEILRLGEQFGRNLQWLGLWSMAVQPSTASSAGLLENWRRERDLIASAFVQASRGKIDDYYISPEDDKHLAIPELSEWHD